MYQFTAHACVAEELADLESFVVALYDSMHTPSHGLELQKSLEPDDQDDELGMGTYCVVTPDGRTHYGGIRHLTVHGNRLVIDLDPQAAAVFGSPGFDITLDIPANRIDDILAGLARLFANDPHAPVVRVTR